MRPRDSSLCGLNTRGFTLVEMLISIALMGILLSASVGVILIASRALPESNSPYDQALQDVWIADRMTQDLQYATSVTALSSRSVTFTVSDRDHDAAGAETIQYTWNGTPGASLTRTYNSVPQTVLQSVELFDLCSEIAQGKLLGVDVALQASGSSKPVYGRARLLNEPETP